MQQSSSQQLKCYGRRNRSKPEPLSTLECGPPLGKKEDVGRAAAADSEETTPSFERKTEVLTHLKSSPQSGSRGRPKKVIGSLKQGERGPSHVAGKNMPTTRAKSAGKPLASEAGEASRDVTTPLEDSSSPSEASTLKTPEGSPDRLEETVISSKSEGPLRNGGSEYGRRKSLASISGAGSQRTRSQIAKEEAQQASGGGQFDHVARVIKEKKSGGQVIHGRKDGGQVIAERKSSGGGSVHLERKDGGHSLVRDRENVNVSKQSSLAASRRYLALQKRQREDMVLLQADEIFRKQEFVDANKDKKGQPKSKEPARLKTHWDFVIEEMTWLAKDFERERKWKLNQAKKVAIRVSRSKLDVEARENRRLKEEELRVRRVASGIAKDVKKFWLKVDKLVSYKQQLLIEERKKKALDKHLDFLLGQTERYSTMLAENLADTTGLESQNTLLLPPVPLNDSADIGQELVPVEGVFNNEGNQMSEVNVVMELGGGDEDFMLEDEEEQEDDEATLEADEALITEEERKEELSALQRESELPIEELLRAYSSLRSSTDSEAEVEEDEEDEETDEEDVIAEEEKLASDALDVDACKDKPHTEKRKVEEGPSTSKEIEEVAVLKGRGLGAPGSEKENGDTFSVVLESLGALRGLELDVTGKVCINLQDEANLDMDKFLGLGKIKFPDVVGEAASSSMSSPHDRSKAEQAFEAGNPTTLVVELADGNPQSFSVTSSERNLQRQSHLSTGFLDPGMARELQDDSDYIPAALADGNDEDDERTLEEEERMASDEGAGTIDEIDQLKLESEMSIEELLAKYRSAANEVGEDFEEFSPDRRDRTSEAGTSGSSDEEDDDVEDEVARDVAEAKERMGEPSTSGRFHPSVVLTENGKRKEKSQLIDTLEVKQEVVDAKVLGGGHENLQEMGRRLQEPKGPEFVIKNRFLSGASSKHALSATSLLLEADGEDDAETAAAVAKVTAAAKQRRERVVMRSVKMRDILGNESEAAAQIKIEARANLDDGVKNSLPTAALEVVESVDDTLTNPSSDRVVYDSNPSNTDVPNLDLVDMDPLGITTSSVEDETMLTTPGDISNLMDEKQTASPVKEDITELVDDGSVELKQQEAGAERSNEDKLADFAAAAQSAQPTGYTFSTTKVKTKLPFLLKHSLREYQHIGLDWLVTMYEKRLNGILADEMGLGKTIMTIALLAHLACEKGIWGPHLIVVPTSVMLNWETEFMKWCPAFKILTYFGNAKERKVKRQGWSRPNSFHVCITTYRLVIQDAKAFKRKKWKYLILDEAHLIKNWKSQRWQTLLNFNSKRRILLTGTPLQNDLMELWSLMHFLMPHVFQSHQEFRDWFSNPITGMVEGENQVNKELVDRLHNVLRPFLLRRLKKDVEKQLPGKFEHVIRCRLSKRQRNLYEDFMASSDTQATLSSGNFLGLINVLMQLRKVCNHPDLFEGRPIISSFDMPGIEVHFSTAACSAMSMGPFDGVNMEALNLLHLQQDESMTKWEVEEVAAIKTPGSLIVELASTGEDTWKQYQSKHKPSKEVRSVIEEIQSVLQKKREKERKERVLAISSINELRCNQNPLYGADFVKCVEVAHPVYDVHKVKANPSNYLEFSSVIANIVQLPLTRFDNLMDLIAAFVFAIPAARAPLPVAWCSHLPHTSEVLKPSFTEEVLQEATAMLVPLRPVVVRRQLFFPDRRLLQFDCGKLQELAVLLRRLKSEGHRALIFTQMTKMLDVLESFINLYGYTYMRLDGSTKPEQRQILMQRFNTNPKIFLFILSTRSGGVGINLVGADTVIFYDSDWNPAMDQQAQDRCHRIGQTREVHIYRLISESTIEENILKKANQKRILDDLVIQSGSYNTEFFKKLDPMELFSGLKGVKVGSSGKGSGITAVVSPADTSVVSSVRITEQKELSNAEVEAALRNAEDEADYMAMKRVEQEEAAENQEFTEEVFAGNLDDEDLADDVDDVGRTGKSQTEGMGVGGLPKGDRLQEDGGIGVTPEDIPFGESSIIPADADEDMDMLADVRQMAAAAAASGRGSVSFEDQLRPIERYAMRFLELWDPRVDNLAVEAQVAFEEKEWELDQLEKLKEEQEAEIDEDNEPLYYETWDTALADEAYRQQVDILVQQQEQKQLEWEAMEEELRDADRAVAEAAAAVVGAENFTMKSKGKKKLKKAKFKSLAEGSLISDTDDASLGEDYTPEGSNDPTYRDLHSDMLPLPHRSPSQRKRKAPKLLDEEMLVEMHTKKFKKDLSNKTKGFSAEKDKGKKKSLDGNSSRMISGDASDHCWPGAVNEEGMVLPRALVGPGGASSGGKNKAGGKIIILGMHPKKGPLVMLEKERKKDFSRSQDHMPPASPWKHAEDAVLCAVVHEYGGNWQLASDALAGGPDGGVYRGRHRHPIHCRERFRQLLAQNAAAASGDPTSEKSALSAATNAQLKVTEEHTKRLLDAVLQHSDDELLLQRHFMAVLTAFQNWKKQSSEKLPTTSGMHSPRGRSFVPLQNLVQPHPLLPSLGKRKVSPHELMAALAQADKEPKSASNQGPQRASSKELAAKDQSSKVNDEAFSVAQFLVGFNEVEGEGASQDDGVALQSHSLPSPISLEAFLGISTTVPSPPPPHFAKAVRHLGEILVENRFRFATRIGWDGSAREWAAAGGSGTGVLGVHLPTKGKGAAKKRPAPDPSKPPKPKQPKTPKTSLKKDGSGEPSSTVESGERTKGPPAQNGESRGTGTPSSELPGPSGSPEVGDPVMKTSTSRPKKNPKHSAVPSPQSGTGQLDLNVQQPDVLLLEAGSKVINSKKVKKAGGTSALGGSEMSQRTEKKNSKATPPSANHLAVDPVAGAKVGVEYPGSRISAVQALSSASKWKGSPPVRGFDLNGSSDEDLTVLGVSLASSGRRLHGSSSPMTVPIGRSELSRFISGADTLGSSKHSDEDRDGFRNLNYSGLTQRATANTPQARNAQSPARLGPYPSPGSLASLRGDPKSGIHPTPGNPGPLTSPHLMRRPDWQTLSASPAQDHLLASSLSKGLSHFHWSPAPGSWPLPFPNDLDNPADMMRFADTIDISPSGGTASVTELPAFPSLKGKHNTEGLPQFKSPVEQEAGQSPGKLPSSLVSRLQTHEGRSWMANARGDHLLPHEILERQRHGGPNLHPQPPVSARTVSSTNAAVAGHSPPGVVDPSRQSLGYTPPGSSRSPFGASSLPLQHSHSRPHVSPSRTMKAPPSLQPPSSPNPPMYNHPSFPGFTLQPFRSSESPAAVDTDLGLSLGSGVPKKQLGVNILQDHQPHTSSS